MKKNYLLVAFVIAISMGFFSCKEKKKELPPVEMLPPEELHIEQNSIEQQSEESSPVESFSEGQPAVESSATEQLPEEHFTKEEVEQRLIAEGLREDRFVVDQNGKYYAVLEDMEWGMTMYLGDSAISGYKSAFLFLVFDEIGFYDVKDYDLLSTGKDFSVTFYMKDGNIYKGTLDPEEREPSVVYADMPRKTVLEKRLEKFEKQGIKENWYVFDDNQVRYSYINAGESFAIMAWGYTDDFYTVGDFYHFPDLTEDDIEDASVVSSGSLFIGTVKTKDGNTYTHTFDTSKFGRPNSN